MSKMQSKLNLTQVGRVCVTVADTDRAIDFYVNTLGFEKVVDVPMGPDMRWVEVAIPGTPDDDRARPAAAGQSRRRQPDRHLPRHVRRRCRPRRAEGGRRGRRRGGHAVRRSGAADVLAARPGRQLADRRPAAGLTADARARPATRPVAWPPTILKNERRASSRLEPGRAGTGLLLVVDRHTILLDCGPGSQSAYSRLGTTCARLRPFS